jgi:tetratricopeptide (TPR) repeat protein
MKRLALLALLLAGCASRPDVNIPAPPAPVEERPGVTGEAPVPRPPALASENVAVASLVSSARADSAAGRLANAGATLERALRIEPRNARLWQELARVRLQQGDYAQAESMAARSNAWAGADAALQAENWRLIADARIGRGDTQGARAAMEAAARAGQPR